MAEGESGAFDQLVGLCTMLAMLARHLPDDVLVSAIRAVGGPRLFAETVIQVQSCLAEENTELLEAAQAAMSRVRGYLTESAVR